MPKPQLKNRPHKRLGKLVSSSSSSPSKSSDQFKNLSCLDFYVQTQYKTQNKLECVNNSHTIKKKKKNPIEPNSHHQKPTIPQSSKLKTQNHITINKFKPLSQKIKTQQHKFNQSNERTNEYKKAID